MTERQTAAGGVTLREALERWSEPQTCQPLIRAAPRDSSFVRRGIGGSIDVPYVPAARVVWPTQPLVDLLACGDRVATGYPDRLSPGPPSRIEQHQWSLAAGNISWNLSRSEVTLGRQLYVGVRVYQADEFARLSVGQLNDFGKRAESSPLLRRAHRTHLGLKVAAVAESIPSAKQLRGVKKPPYGAIAGVVNELMKHPDLKGENRASVERNFRTWRRGP